MSFFGSISAIFFKDIIARANHGLYGYRNEGDSTSNGIVIYVHRTGGM
jgi:hypothetical protein